MSEQSSEIADLLAPFWSTSRTQDALGMSEPQLAAERAAGYLLGVTPVDGESVHYPVAQFESREGRVRVRPPLREFMAVLRNWDPWTVGILLKTPAPELDDHTPLDWVRNGQDVEVLVRYAHILDAELSR